MGNTMNINLKVWRQENENASGKFEEYKVQANPDMSFLEMFDVLNEQLIEDGKDPIAFDHDCREGICGMCSMVINGRPHGPKGGVTTCQLHMRSFKDGDTVVVEPWRANAFPVVKDLSVNRGAFDRIISSGGYVSVNTGSAVDANAVLIPKETADTAFQAATCIGCGACVSACKNASAMLFVGAKVTQLAGEDRPLIDRFALHAKSISFNVLNNTAVTVDCPYPKDYEVFLKLLRKYGS